MKIDGFSQEQRAAIAEIVERVAFDGLEHPRDPDVALDAIECVLKEVE